MRFNVMGEKETFRRLFNYKECMMVWKKIVTEGRKYSFEGYFENRVNKT